MSHPNHTASVKLIDREEFLAAVDPRRVMLLRMRTETPGVHLLGLFTNEDLRHAIIQEIGPQGVHRDIRAASEATPSGLRLTYVVPCVECAPFSLPQHIAKSTLPPSLSELKSPAGMFAEPGPALTTDKKTGFMMTSTPARTAIRSVSTPPTSSKPEIATPIESPGGAHRPEVRAKKEADAPPTEAVPASEILTAQPQPNGAQAKTEPAGGPTGDAPASIGKAHEPAPKDLSGSTLDHIHRAAKSIEALRAHELKLHREEAEFREHCAQRIKDLDARELNLARREQELKTRTAELNNLLSRIDGLRRRNFPTDSR